MTEDREGSVPTQSVLKEISAALKEKGTFDRDLSPQEVEQFMSEIVTSMIAERGGIQASIKSLSVTIENARAKLEAQLAVKKAFVKANVAMTLELENSSEQGRLKTSSEPQASTSNGLAKPYVETARQGLSDPNALIFKGLSQYFAKQQINISQMGLTLRPNTLGVQLTVQPK